MPHRVRNAKSLRDLLLTHELIFIALILLAVISGAYGIHIWDKTSKESQRINLLVQEIYQVRGDLYRQMKELFDAFFLQDAEALDEYNAYTQSVLKHFGELKNIADGEEEKKAISEIEQNYRIFVNEAPALFYRYQARPDRATQKTLYKDIETGIFSRYEDVSKRAEILLGLKQHELKTRLAEAKTSSIAILSIPVLLAGILLFFSRFFLKKAIVNPINAMMHATQEISAGNLSHKVPETGAKELATLSQEINKMAEDLLLSRDALVRTEKQAALGLLVPMLAHNIRNPLASIRATAQIADSPEHDKDTRESLQGIISTVDRLERWTGALLAYLNPIKPQLSPAKLSNIVQGSTGPLSHKLVEKQIKLVTDLSKAKGEVLTDEHLLEQVLYNLILNAIEASPKQASIYLNATLTRQQLEISIRDEGSGMPFVPNPHAVSPGPTTKRFGTGLGIPFAFKVCEVLNGHVEFMAVQPKGTLIRISLPQ
jgi:signal transduction histidine kinase